MLAQAGSSSEIDVSAYEPLEVLLPQHLASFFDENGYSSTSALEQRGNARLRIRTEAKIQFVYTPPAFHRNVKFATVLVSDLSRSGVCILFHEQIYPEEQFKLILQGRMLHYVAVRCRREGKLCYQTGARLLALDRALDEPAD